MKISYNFYATVKEGLSVEEQQKELERHEQIHASILSVFYNFFKKKIAFSSVITPHCQDANKLVLAIKMEGSLPLDKMYHLTAILEHYAHLMSNSQFHIDFDFQSQP